MKTHNNAPVLLLSTWAKTIMDEKYKNPDYEIALELIKTGMRCTDIKEGWQADLLAQAYFKTGNIEKGLETQQLALKSMEAIPEFPAEMIAKAQARMESYKGQKNKTR